MKQLKQGDYNDRQFLVQDSIRSCASYHAKVINLGGTLKLLFRVNDCNNGVKLINNANDRNEAQEMIEKLRSLAAGATAFADFLQAQTNNKQ